MKTVFQGANDGMMHAFIASDGVESWAYVPSFLFNGPSKLRDLSKRVNFSHQYYVDATPVAGDVDFRNTVGATETAALWKTVLIGGLGKGGRGYFALDVTTPTAASESDAREKVLWEFPNSGSADTTVALTTPAGTTGNGFTMAANKVGYTYGKPLIVKTKAHGWVALATSGYNNGSDTGGDGHGYLFVLNVRTGALLHAFDTSVGDSGATNGPSGLAYISAFVPDAAYDSTVEYVYGGDLFGNVWRFDLNNVDTGQWRLKKLAQLVDSSSTKQPVTTAPELATVLISGATKRFVFVGTGQYFGDSDIPGASGANTHASQTQTMYGLVDDLSNPTGSNVVISPLRSSLVQQTLTTSNDERTATSSTVNYATKKGWYIDLPETGERINTQPVLAVGALVFTSNIPNSDVCTPGGAVG
ncbi:MAG: PilC/PilY family type IV pilus protein [Propionivibrio sp.]